MSPMQGPLIKVVDSRGEPLQLENWAEFANAVQQADHGPGDQVRRIRGVIYVSNDQVRWKEYAVVTLERWKPEPDGGLPKVEDKMVAEIARPSGYRYAQFRWGSFLGFNKRQGRR